jgi:UDP-glucose:tetrahydrobiopterin glucosyltransferase
MGRVNEATDLEIERLARAHPERVAFVSRSQAEAFGAQGDAPLLKPGLDLSLYPFSAEPERGAAIWAGRIAPEKGLMEAARAAHAAGKRLKVAGAVTDELYFEGVRSVFPETIDYLGYLDQPALARALGSAEALLLTQAWAEAFGILSIEALAVGTPLIAFDRGANRQFVRPGETGYLVQPGDVAGIADALGRVGKLSRPSARALVERDYSLAAMGRDLDAWFARQPKHAF